MTALFRGAGGSFQSGPPASTADAMTGLPQGGEGALAEPGASRLSRLVLAVSGLLAVGIGGAILLVPVAFYEGYGIDLSSSPSLLSETRAAGGLLLANGCLVLGGAIVSRGSIASAAVGAVTYLSYGLSRAISIAIDGVPERGLVVAALVEVTIGLACAVVLARHCLARRRRAVVP